MGDNRFRPQGVIGAGHVEYMREPSNMGHSRGSSSMGTSAENPQRELGAETEWSDEGGPPIIDQD